MKSGFLIKSIDEFKLLLGINTIIFLLSFLLLQLSGDASGDDGFYRLTSIFKTEYVNELKLWVIMTFNFVHYDPIHFGFNIYALYAIGKLVKHFYGNAKLFIVYILAGLMAGIFTYLWSSFSGNEILTLGASGAIFGLLGILVGGATKKDAYGNTTIPIDVKAFYPTLILSFLISLLPNINFAAHLGGFLTGFTMAYILKPEDLGYHNVADQKLTKLLYRISAVIFLLSSCAFAANFINVFLTY